MRYIELTNGGRTLVDDEDFDELSKINWQHDTHGYAAHGILRDGKHIYQKMHYFILEQKEGLQVDHINRDRLDNRRANLRYATRSQNTANAIRPNSHGYRGVRKDCNTWTASAQMHGKRTYVRGLKTLEEAALAYNELSTKLHGDFAVLNVVKYQ